MAKRFWLMKSEPNTYSIDDLKRDKKTLWDGVRNYQARNFMRDQMQSGDEVLFYHSNATPPGVAGIATVTKTAHVDPTAFDKKSRYFDEKSSPEQPRWYCAEIKYKKKLKFVPLPTLRETKGLQKMALLKRGMRLSVQPVSPKEFSIICRLGGQK